MASPNPCSKRRSPPGVSVGQRRSYHTSSFVCKSVFFAMALLAVPLFPSQAPDFVGDTVLTKFWELILLVFVGIAVSYGLFSRRNVDLEVDSQMSRVDESSHSYVSRMFHLYSFFDYGYENSCDFDEKNENRSVDAGLPTSVLDEENKSESIIDERQREDSFEYGKSIGVQAWNSQYFQGRSKVVVAQPAYALDYIGHKSLGLPVRSLRPTLIDTQAADGSQGHEFGSNFNGSSGSYEEAPDGSLGSIELGETFDEFRAPSSPVHLHSRSERMGTRENLGGGTHVSHFRPLSVGESQFESIKSRSSRCTATTSSQGSFVSQTQSRFSPAHSASAESLSSNLEELSKEKDFQGSSRSSSPSPLPSSPNLSPSPSASPSQSSSPPSSKSVTDDTSRHTSHTRRNSDDYLLEEDVRRGYKENLDGVTYRGRTIGLSGMKEFGSRSLKLNAEYFRNEKSSRRSYPPDLVPPPIDGEDPPSRRCSQQNSSHRLLEDYTGKSREEDSNNLRGGLRDNSIKRRSRNRGCSEPGRESYEKDGISLASSSQNAESPLINSKSSRHAMHSWHGSYGSLLEKDLTRNLEDDSGDFIRSRRRESLESKELNSGTLRWEPSSGRAANKVSLRAKSIRTIRPGRYCKELSGDGELCEDWAEAEAERKGKAKLRSRGQENVSNEISQKNLGHAGKKPKPRYLEYRNDRAKQSSINYMIYNSEDPKVKETEQPQVSIEEEPARESLSDSGHGPDEVDRKAAEFIAKFREQMRLQKLSSGELPRGMGSDGGMNLK